LGTGMRALHVRATTKNAYQAQKVAFCSLLPSVVPAAGLLGKRTGKLSVKHMPAVVPWEITDAREWLRRKSADFR